MGLEREGSTGSLFPPNAGKYGGMRPSDNKSSEVKVKPFETEEERKLRLQKAQLEEESAKIEADEKDIEDARYETGAKEARKIIDWMDEQDKLNRHKN